MLVEATQRTSATCRQDSITRGRFLCSGVEEWDLVAIMGKQLLLMEFARVGVISLL